MGPLICRYGTVMGGLLSEKFLDTNLSIPFAGPPLNTPSLQKYKRVCISERDYGLGFIINKFFCFVNNEYVGIEQWKNNSKSIKLYVYIDDTGWKLHKNEVLRVKPTTVLKKETFVGWWFWVAWWIDRKVFSPSWASQQKVQLLAPPNWSQSGGTLMLKSVLGDKDGNNQ